MASKPRATRFGPGRYEYSAGKRNYSAGYAAQVDDIVTMTEKRMLALQRESIQRTVDLMQTPVAKGGRMRVDTGFLRASGQSSLNGMPTGPTRPAKDALPGAYQPNGIEATLAQMGLGATFFFGWTAAYAKYREAFDGFLEAGVQRWPQTVTEVAAEIVKRINNRNAK